MKVQLRLRQAKKVRHWRIWFTLCLVCIVFNYALVLPTRAATDARVRIVLTDTNTSDIFLDGKTIFNNVSFGSATTYTNVSPGSHLLQVAPAGQEVGGAQVTRTLNFESNGGYTLATSGKGNTLQTFQDSLDVSAGQASLRLYNLSPDSGIVNLVNTPDNNVISGLGSNQASDTSSLAPGSYNYSITDNNGNTLDSTTINPAANTTESLFVIGRRTGTPVLRLISAQEKAGQIAQPTVGPPERPTAQGATPTTQSAVTPTIKAASPTTQPATPTIQPTSPSISPTPTAVAPALQPTSGADQNEKALVRLIHAAPISKSIDILLDGDPLFTGISFSYISPYTAISAGTHTFQIVPAGLDASAAIVDTSLTFAGNTPYTLAFLGTTTTNLELHAIKDDTTAVAEKGRLRVYNFAPDVGELKLAASPGPGFSALIYKSASDYRMLDPGTYTFATNDGKLPGITITISADTVISLVALGLVQGNPSFTLITAQVGGAPALPGGGSDPEAGNLFDPGTLFLWLVTVVLLAASCIGMVLFHRRLHK